MSTLKKKVRAKIVNAITDYDLPRVKRYKKKYNVSVNNADFGNGATILHIACSQGKPAIIRYLIKKGADLLLTNKSGELPGHLLADYLMSDAEGDNVEDILDTFTFMKRKCAESMHTPDPCGFTVQMVVDQYFRQNKQRQSESDSGRANGSSGHASFFTAQHKEEDDSWARDRAWEERLRAEMDEDYISPDWTAYNDEEEAETWDGWASRMSDEYRNRKRPYGSTMHQPPQQQASDHPASGSGGISDEKKQKFEENLRKKAKLETAALSRKKMEALVKEKRVYEIKCRKLFDSKTHHRHVDDKEGDKVVSMLTFADIPWPPEGSGELLEFLGCDIDKSTTQPLQLYVRQQRIRWHPDKFSQRCGHRLLEADRSRIMDRVKTVSQMMNDLVAKLTTT